MSCFHANIRIKFLLFLCLHLDFWQVPQTKVSEMLHWIVGLPLSSFKHAHICSLKYTQAMTLVRYLCATCSLQQMYTKHPQHCVHDKAQEDIP